MKKSLTLTTLLALVLGATLPAALPAQGFPRSTFPGQVRQFWRSLKTVGDFWKAVANDSRFAAWRILALNPEFANLPDYRWRMPLSLATTVPMAQLLIDHGADPNLSVDRATLPLHAQVQAGNSDLIRFLLAHGARVDEPARFEGTPLHRAAHYDQVDAARILVEAGADLTLDNGMLYYDTPLLTACRNGSARVAALLIERDTTTCRATCLNVAVEHGGRRTLRTGDEGVVRLLLDAGADANAPPGPSRALMNGDRPLHRAVRLFDASMARLLLARGADVNIRNRDGLTPLQAMQEETYLAGVWPDLYAETRKVLLEAGAVDEPPQRPSATDGITPPRPYPVYPSGGVMQQRN